MEDMIPGLVTLGIGFAIMLGIFLAIRAIVLWYWKIDTIVDNQQKQIVLLSQLIDTIRKIETQPAKSMSSEKQPSHSGH